MIKYMVFAFTGLALAVGSAETFHVTLAYPTVVQGTQLKAGNHKIDLQGNQLVIENGKQRVEVPVTVEQVGKTFRSNMVVYSQAGGKYAIQEIQLGHTKTKLAIRNEESADRVK